ncbi:MAG: DMT family transporter [Gemmatimonadales bacterium]|nr:MAG: DMT family transporter [Gemmatimonadales bacterium]
MSAVLVALAALCWGLAGGIGGILLDDGWDPFVASFYRGLVGLAFVLVWLALRPKGSGLSSPRLWFWSVVAGVGVAGNFAFYFVSIANGSVAVAATLMYSAPVFVFVASFALGLERPTGLKFVAIAAVMVGIALLTQIHDVGGSGITLIGVGAGLLAGVCYALFIFGFKYAAPHGSPQAILTIAFAVLAAILVWPGESDQLFAAPGSPDLALILALGVVGAGLSFVLYVVGLKHTAPAAASIVAMVEPVTASVFGVAILDESLAGLQLLGMGLILVTVTALTVSSSPEESELG